jgi:hypothetical protein
VGVCDNGAGALGGGDEGAGGAGGGVGGHVPAQNVANTLWAYATMGWEPGAGMMRAEGAGGGEGGHVQRAGRGKYDLGCVLSVLRTPGEEV